MLHQMTGRGRSKEAQQRSERGTKREAVPKQRRRCVVPSIDVIPRQVQPWSELADKLKTREDLKALKAEVVGERPRGLGVDSWLLHESRDDVLKSTITTTR